MRDQPFVSNSDMDMIGAAFTFLLSSRLKALMLGCWALAYCSTAA